MKDKIRNKKTIYTIIGIISIILVAIAITYAFWLVSKSQTEKNILSSGCLDITLTNELNDIKLLDTEPITEAEGKKLVPYEFTVTNTCEGTVNYEIALETFQTTSTMQDSSIRVMLDGDESTILSSNKETDPIIDGATKSYVLKTGSLSTKGTTGATESHKLRVWIDFDAPISEMGKTFESKISVSVGQKISNPTLCHAVNEETVTTGNIPTGEYTNGDEYICEVADDVFYHFFVISKNDDDSLNLIMDRNVGTDGTPATSENLSQTAWCSKEDYDAKNEKETLNGTADGVDAYLAENPTYCGTATVMAEEGAITAINALNEYVSSWDNINNYNYSFDVEPYSMNTPNNGELFIPDPAAQSNSLQTAIWTPYKFNQPAKARLMTATEALDNGCKYEINTTNADGSVTKTNVDICPRYLTNYLQHKEGRVTGDEVVDIEGIRGYWLLTGAGCSAYLIHDNGSINVKQATVNNHSGIRPVITVNLSDLDI